jgi:hypothetical protein
MAITLEISGNRATGIRKELDVLAGFILPVVEAGSGLPNVQVRFSPGAMETFGLEKLKRMTARRFDQDGYEVTVRA